MSDITNFFNIQNDDSSYAALILFIVLSSRLLHGALGLCSHYHKGQYYRVQVGIQTPEAITTVRAILHRFSDFLKLFSEVSSIVY